MSPWRIQEQLNHELGHNSCDFWDTPLMSHVNDPIHSKDYRRI